MRGLQKVGLILICVGILAIPITILLYISKPQFLNLSHTNSIPNSMLYQNNTTQNIDMIRELSSKVEELEKKVNILNNSQIRQQLAIDAINTQAATQSSLLSRYSSQLKGKIIVAEAHTSGSTFTTQSTVYTPMGMYVNVNCPVNCLLWINFYTDTRNQGTPASAQGYFNIYDIFIDTSDQSILTQASFPAAGMATPLSLNAAIPVSKGPHTIEIRTKTTGGILESRQSTLQVMALSQ